MASSANETEEKPLVDPEEKARLRQTLVDKGLSEDVINDLYKGGEHSTVLIGRQEEDVKEVIYSWMDLGEEEVYQKEMALQRKFAPKIPKKATMNVEENPYGVPW